MNYIVLVLDDLPAGSIINLMCIPKRANVFLLGFKAASLDMLYDCLDFYEKLDRREDGHTVEWGRFLAKYLVKSVTYDTVNTLFLAMINYQGTRVKCTMFYAILCLFANPKDMSKFSAQRAQTDTLTYQAMLALTFRELLVLPVSADPPNILAVTQIDFDRKNYRLHMSRRLDDDRGFFVEEDWTLQIGLGRIKSCLIVYSVAGNCVMKATEEAAGKTAKGLSFACIDVGDIKDIEYMVTLERPRDSDDNGAFSFEGSWDSVVGVDGSFEISTGRKAVVVKNVRPFVVGALDVRGDADIRITMSGRQGAVIFGQPQLVSSRKVVNFGDARTQVSFTDIIFSGRSPSLSLVLVAEAAKVVADSVEVGPLVAASVDGGLEVREELDIGPDASIEAATITAPGHRCLVLGYRVREKFGSVLPWIEPSSVVLSYIGESDSADDVSDYAPFFGGTSSIRAFCGDDHRARCEEWLSMTSLASALYQVQRQQQVCRHPLHRRGRRFGTRHQPDGHPVGQSN